MNMASTPGSTGPSIELWNLAIRCSTAWSNQDPEGMASCYEESGQQSINHGAPSVGRKALAEVAASYMEAFPDLKVSLDQLLVAGDEARYASGQLWVIDGGLSAQVQQMRL